MTISAEIQQYIDNAASQFGVSSGFLSTMAQIESGGNPNANNGVAQGLFQFTPGTAAQFGITDPFDPQQSANGAAQLALSAYNSLSKVLGTVPQDWQLYIAHQQGIGGATALLSADPNQPAAQALMNAGVGSTKAFNSISQNLGSDFNGNPATATVGQFLSYWQNKWTSISGGSANASTVTGGSTGTLGIGNIGGAASSTGTSQSASSGGIASALTGWASHWFVRAFVFLLGLVFVAGGLFLFGKVSSLTLEKVQDNTASGLANAISKPAPQRVSFVGATPAPVTKALDEVKKTGSSTRKRRSSGELAQHYHNQAVIHAAKEHAKKKTAKNVPAKL